MTKEQEEAIEYLKKHIKYFEEQIKFIEATDCDYYDEELELYQNRVKQFNIVLSMLKEKDKQIEQYQNILATNDMLHVIECENKDKQIDLMADAMRYYNGMQQEQEFCIEICEKKECNIEKCKECIKQYFEEKAKEFLNK